MELRHLRYFVAVAEERHFGRAAERLHIAQPPLSQQIRRFEAELGEPLLYRTTRSVELSPAGEVMLERGREILAAVDAAVEDARRAARGEYGRLAIGFTGSVDLRHAARRWPPRCAANCPAWCSTSAANCSPPPRSPGCSTARSTSASCALRSTSATSAPRCCAPSRWSPCSPRSHPLAAEEAVPLELLAGEPFVTYPSHFRSVVHDAVEDACAAHGFEPLAAHEVAETATLVSFVAAGLGVSLVPASVQNMTVRGAVYRPLANDSTRVELAVAWRRNDERPVLVRALDVIRRDLHAGSIGHA